MGGIRGGQAICPSSLVWHDGCVLPGAMIENLVAPTVLPETARETGDRPAAAESAVLFAALLAGLAAPAPAAEGGGTAAGFPGVTPGQQEGGVVPPGDAEDLPAVAGVAVPAGGPPAATVPEEPRAAVLPDSGPSAVRAGTGTQARMGTEVVPPGSPVLPTVPGVGVGTAAPAPKRLPGRDGLPDLPEGGRGDNGSSGRSDGEPALPGEGPAATVPPTTATLSEIETSATARPSPQMPGRAAVEAASLRPEPAGPAGFLDANDLGEGEPAGDRRAGSKTPESGRDTAESPAAVPRAPAGAGVSLAATNAASAPVQPVPGWDDPTVEGGADPLPAGAPSGPSGSAAAPQPTAGSVPATPPTPPPPQVRSMPVAQLGLFVVRAASQQLSHLVVRLEPATLGRVEISLRFKDDGRVAASFRAQQGDALQMLRAEAPAFARLFAEHGIELAAGGLDFGMMQGEAGARDDRPAPAATIGGDPAVSAVGADPGGASTAPRLGLLDLTV